MKFIYSLFIVGSITACNSTADNTSTSDSSSTTMSDHNNMSMNDSSTNHGNTSGQGTGSGSENMTLSESDKDFMMKAAMGNAAEIEAGTMAQQKGSNAAVKEFGATMVKDHTDAGNQLKGIASSLSMMAPDSLDNEHKAMKKKISSLSGAKFDREYMMGQVKDHQMMITLFEGQSNNGSHTRLKQFATNTLPHLKMHLQMADSVLGKLKK